MEFAKSGGLHQFFKVQPIRSTSSMVLIDADGTIKTYDDAMAILKEFFTVRFIINWICFQFKFFNSKQIYF